MEIKNIERAQELLPQFRTLALAKRLLSEADAAVTVSGSREVLLPKCMRLNILNAVSCEYERIRKEVEGL